MEDYIYTPGVKTKRGEMRALRELSEQSAATMLPLIDLLAIADGTSPAGVQAHIEKCLRYLAGAWSRSRPIYFDLFDVGPAFRGPNDAHPVTLAFEILRDYKFEAIPVVGLDRDAAYLRAVRRLIANDGGMICVRLQEEDFLDPYHTISQVRSLLQHLGAAELEKHVVLDFRSIEHKDLDQVRAYAIGMQQALSYESFSRVVLLASSMKASLSALGRNSVTQIQRKEMQVWRDIRRRFPGLAYGDYGVVHPDYVDLDPRIIRPAAKIRYATPSSWIIVKGKQWILDTGQYRQLAAMVMRQPQHRATASGWGEAYLRECAFGRERPGTLETWVSIDTNVHLEFTSRHIARVQVGTVAEPAQR